MNKIQALVDRLLARGMLALREASIMPRLIHRDFDSMATRKGASIEVPVPSAQEASDVVPGHQYPEPSATEIEVVEVKLDKWKKTNFFLTDKDENQILASESFIPMQTTEAVKVIANTIDKSIMELGKDFYGAVGTAGTTPFDDGKTRVATKANALLNKQLAPTGDRFAVLDPDAYGAAQDLRAFQDTSWRGDKDGINEGDVARKFGVQWRMDQNVLEHTTTAKGDGVVNARTDAGATSLVTKSFGTVPGVGDIFTVAGSDQQHVVTSANGTTINFYPALAEQAAANAAITVVASHRMNLVFNRNAMTLVTRPLSGAGSEFGVMQSSIVDEISGIALRLEVVRQYKQFSYEFDVLYGVGTLRREFGVRLLG